MLPVWTLSVAPSQVRELKPTLNIRPKNNMPSHLHRCVN
nr:MAG TPA: hypothetical protein [Bacteriophage sp.]